MWDNSSKGGLTLPITLDKLHLFAEELTNLVTTFNMLLRDAEDAIPWSDVVVPASTKPVSQQMHAAHLPQAQAARTGLLTNPLTTLVTDVTSKTIPSKNKPGQTFQIFEVVTGAAKFGTLDKKIAAGIAQAKADGVQVTINWKLRMNGTFPNYDIVSAMRAE